MKCKDCGQESRAEICWPCELKAHLDAKGYYTFPNGKLTISRNGLSEMHPETRRAMEEENAIKILEGEMYDRGSNKG